MINNFSSPGTIAQSNDSKPRSGLSLKDCQPACPLSGNGDDLPFSAPVEREPTATCRGSGGGILWSRLRHLFNIATTEHQFQRIVRWIRKSKTT